MVVTYELKPGTKPSPEQIKMIEEAAKMPISFDEDSPELTPELAEGFRKAALERDRRNQRNQA